MRSFFLLKKNYRQKNCIFFILRNFLIWNLAILWSDEETNLSSFSTSGILNMIFKFDISWVFCYKVSSVRDLVDLSSNVFIRSLSIYGTKWFKYLLCREFFVICNIIFGIITFFKNGIHSLKGSRATARHVVTRKRRQKD